MIVGIDAGHGGSDPGAFGKGMKEKDINKNVANQLMQLLHIENIETAITRTSDVELTLSDRAKLFNSAGCDCAVSVHHNAGGGDGFEVIYQCDHKYTADSKLLADCIANEFRKLNNERRVFCRPSTKNANEDYYTVLAKTNRPAVITEFAFLDTADVDSVDTLTEQYAEAEAIKSGIIAYGKAKGLLQAASQINPDIQTLVNYGVIKDPAYWAAHAVPGSFCDGSIVKQLIANMANKLKED